MNRMLLPDGAMIWHLKAGPRGATECGLTLMYGVKTINSTTCLDCRDAYYAR
jgi:hypothetical protein